MKKHTHILQFCFAKFNSFCVVCVVVVLLVASKERFQNLKNCISEFSNMS